MTVERKLSGFVEVALPRLVERLNEVDFFVYCVWPEGTSTVKIGKSKNHPVRRARSLATAVAQPLRLVAYTTEASEREMHRKLWRYHLRGEHFLLSIALLEEVETWTWIDSAVLARMKALLDSQR